MQVPDAEPKVEPIKPGGANKPYEVLGQSYVPLTADEPLTERGQASWYGRKFHGRRTASGELYNMHAMTAAHKTMPIPSYARVRNPANGREVIVRVNDRGPFTAGRVIDLSWAAAVKLGVQNGVAPIEVSRITHDEIRQGKWLTDRPASGAANLDADARPELATTAALATAAPVRPAAPATLLPLSRSSAPERSRALTEAGAGFWVQLGAFSRAEGALLYHRQLATEMGWLAPLMAVFTEGGIHRLQAGPYSSREQAREAADRVRAAVQLEPVVLERR